MINRLVWRYLVKKTFKDVDLLRIGGVKSRYLVNCFEFEVNRGEREHGFQAVFALVHILPSVENIVRLASSFQKDYRSGWANTVLSLQFCH
jgi:hypothetical protein